MPAFFRITQMDRVKNHGASQMKPLIISSAPTAQETQKKIPVTLVFYSSRE
jgi:hypothetical protein